MAPGLWVPDGAGGWFLLFCLPNTPPHPHSLPSPTCPRGWQRDGKATPAPLAQSPDRGTPEAGPGEGRGVSGYGRDMKGMEKGIRDSEEESELEGQHRQPDKGQMEGSRVARHDTKQLYLRALAC